MFRLFHPGRAALGLRLAVLTVVAAAAYGNTLLGEYCYDDTTIIADRRAIERLSAARWLFSSEYGPQFGELSYRPVVTTTYFLDGWLFGKRPAATALINLTLHLLAGIALYALWSLLYGRIPLAFWSAAFFLCHPIVSETVNCGGFREEILCLLFLASALICAGHALTVSGARIWIPWSLAAAAAWTLALLSKETAAMGAILAPMLYWRAPAIRDAYRANRPEFHRRTAGLVASCGAGAAGALMLYFAFSFAALSADWPGGRGPILGFLNFCRVFLLDLRLWLWPVGLSVGHEFTPSGEFGDWRLWSAFAVGAVFLGASLWNYARGRLIGVGGLWVVIAMIPVSQIIPSPELVAERFLYIPHAGFALALAAAITGLSRAPSAVSSGLREASGRSRFRQRAGSAIAIAAAAACILLAARRNLDWSDDVTLNIRRYALWKGAEGQEALGVLYLRRDEQLAEIHLLEALRLDPGRPAAHRGLAALYARSGRMDDARRHLMEAHVAQSDAEMLLDSWDSVDPTSAGALGDATTNGLPQSDGPGVAELQ